MKNSTSCALGETQNKITLRSHLLIVRIVITEKTNKKAGEKMSGAAFINYQRKHKLGKSW